MPLNTDSTIEELQGRAATMRGLTDGAEDISGGVQAAVGDVQAVTLYLSTAGPVDVTVEFSPDGGDSWFEPVKESPVGFGEAGQDVVHITYNTDRIRLTGSNTSGVDARLREVV